MALEARHVVHSLLLADTRAAASTTVGQPALVLHASAVDRLVSVVAAVPAHDVEGHDL